MQEVVLESGKSYLVVGVRLLVDIGVCIYAKCGHTPFIYERCRDISAVKHEWWAHKDAYHHTTHDLSYI